MTTIGKKSFIIYINPNNVTNNAYLAIGEEVREVKQSAKSYPDSYRILRQGRGDESYKKAKESLTQYKIVEN